METKLSHRCGNMESQMNNNITIYTLRCQGLIIIYRILSQRIAYFGNFAYYLF